MLESYETWITELRDACRAVYHDAMRSGVTYGRIAIDGRGRLRLCGRDCGAYTELHIAWTDAADAGSGLCCYTMSDVESAGFRAKLWDRFRREPIYRPGDTLPAIVSAPNCVAS